MTSLIILVALAFMALMLAFVAAVHANDRRKLRAFASSVDGVRCASTSPQLAFTIATGKG